MKKRNKTIVIIAISILFMMFWMPGCGVESVEKTPVQDTEAKEDDKTSEGEDKDDSLSEDNADENQEEVEETEWKISKEKYIGVGGNSETTYTYDEKGNLINERSFVWFDGGPNEDKVIEIRYEYDDDNRLVKQTGTYNGETDYYELHEREYLNDGSTKTTYYDVDGNLNYYIVCQKEDLREKQITYYTSGKVYEEEIEYDESGMWICRKSESYCTCIGGPSSKYPWTTTETYYEDDGTIMDGYEYVFEDDKCVRSNRYEDHTLTHYSLFTYNDEGLRMHVDSFAADGELKAKVDYFYDDGSDRLSQEIGYDNTGKMTYWKKSEYDAAGNELEYIYHSETTPGNSYKLTWKYDSVGHMLEKAQYGYSEFINEWEVEYKWENTYDEYGNLIKSIEYNSYGGIDRTIETTYVSVPAGGGSTDLL